VDLVKLRRKVIVLLTGLFAILGAALLLWEALLARPE
jgi:hypothetical protein